MNMASSDVQVQGSNDWSIASKLSTVEAGYYEDPFIACFAQKPTRRSSLIHRGYYVRATAINYIYKQFLSAHFHNQIVSFGAGYDSSYFRLRKEGTVGESLSAFVEIDFPDVVESKKMLIGKNTGCFTMACAGNYHLVSADLRDLPALKAQLIDSGLLDPSKPTMFVSECSITYMDHCSSSNLIEWCSHTFHNAVFVVYEQIRPLDGFGVVMQRHFNQLGIPLLSLPFLPDKASQQRRYIQKGWTTCSVYDMNEFYQQLIPAEERTRVHRLEDFDEYEGFHEKCAHYVILTAAKGICESLLPPLNNQQAPIQPSLTWKLTESPLQRYGQAGCSIGREGCFAISGGFGSRRSAGHGRLGDLLVVSDEQQTEVKQLDKRLARMYHSMEDVGGAEGDSFLVIYGGRTHPGKALSDVGLLSLKRNQLEWFDPPDDNVAWPDARWRHASCQVDTSDGMVAICGGRTPNHLLNDCWILRDIRPSIRWAPFSALPNKRHSASLSSWNGRLIIFGGLDEEEVHCQDICYISSPLSHTQPEWTQVTWNNGPSPVARYSHRALVEPIKQQLILVGGVAPPGHPSAPGVCVIRLSDWAFVEYALPAQDPIRPVILVGHSASLIKKNSSLNEEENSIELKIRCWAGGGPCFSFGTHLNIVSVEMELPS